MIRITNNVKRFIEEESGEIIIYGAGNAGYWVGYYMERCELQFSSYIDKDKNLENVKCNGHPIYTPAILKRYSKTQIRIIVSPSVYKEILADLLWLDHLWSLNILCAVPHYKDVFHNREEVYNINRFLSYFRRRLFTGDVPTIISNTCVAGHIYESFNMPLLSPTINVGIDANDFVKFCTDLKHYTNTDPEFLYWERGIRIDGQDTKHALFKLDDIMIKFAHLDDENEVKERWELAREYINWNRIIYIMEEQNYRKSISIKMINDFERINGKKLLVLTHNMYGGVSENVVYSRTPYFMVRQQPALENYFDLLAWMNKEPE